MRAAARLIYAGFDNFGFKYYSIEFNSDVMARVQVMICLYF